MNFNKQYKVIGTYNYDKIIHNIEKIYAKRQDICQTNGKMHLVLPLNPSSVLVLNTVYRRTFLNRT